MTNQDRIIAYIRTGFPALVGMFITWLVSKIPAIADWLTFVDAQLTALGFVGVTVNGLLVAGGTAGIIFLYYAAARWLGAKFPPLEKWLLGRSAVPVYVKSGAEADVVQAAVPDPDSREATQSYSDGVIIQDDHLDPNDR